MLEQVKQILGLLELEASYVADLAKGATSRVFLADTQKGKLVIRIAEPNLGKRVQGSLFEADAGIRYKLRKLDQRTAEPLASSGSYTNALANKCAWSVDYFVSGETASRGEIPPQVCIDIGSVLKNLHSLKATAYGRLENNKDNLRGRFNHLQEGVQSRFQDAWPFTNEALSQHPLSNVEASLITKLEPFKEAILHAAQANRYCVVHADLHEQQFLIQSKRLKALIDFGDAMIAAPAWDVASFAYFHGWQLTDFLLKGYSANNAEQVRLVEDAKLLSLTIALHHISRSFTLDLAQRREHALNHLKALANHLGHVQMP